MSNQKDNTSDDFLKREMSFVIRSTKRKRLITMACLILVILGLATPIIYITTRPKTNSKTRGVSIGDPTANSASVASSNSSPAPSSIEPSPSSSHGGTSNDSSSQGYSPTPTALNRAAFIADANAIIGNYSQIVSLLDINTTTSPDVSVSKINSASALENKPFSVTKLRGHLVMAGISSGKYMDVVETAENAVSTISVGLIRYNYWAKDHSRILDFNSGHSLIGEGASILLKLTSQVNSL